jgi:kumamolisin
VGILELGGGYATADLSTYFQGLGLAAPSVTAVSVDGGTNAPGQDTDADGEVMLDIEMVGAIAPGAAIAVYFAPNTDQGFIDGVSTAVHDTTNKPSVVSISWGQSEDSWTAQARTQMEQILTEAAGLGVTVTVAAGDGGSSDSVTDGEQHVDFPASAPHALACGGTTLDVANGQITSETVWNDPGDGATGGGVSRQFPLPSYQASAKVPDNVDTGSSGRGVPDVCADADPNTGYQIRVDGSDETIGGTSAVAPLWAGLIARVNHALGVPVGFVQPRLYPLLGTAAFHDITSGNNGSYSAGAGWDACTGLGSPDGAQLLRGLGTSSADT